MIKRERLEELIELGATIYWICGKDIEKKPLKHKYHKFSVLDNELYEDNEKLGIGIWKHKLSKLFETKEEAEWHREFGCIERTERLELPTWEEFQNKDCVSFISKTGKKINMLNYFFDNEIYISDTWDISERFKYSKDGYTLACVKAKKLFLGE